MLPAQSQRLCHLIKLQLALHYSPALLHKYQSVFQKERPPLSQGY